MKRKIYLKTLLAVAFATVIVSQAKADRVCTDDDVDTVKRAQNIFLGQNKLSDWLDKVKAGALQCTRFKNGGGHIIGSCGGKRNDFSRVTLSSPNTEIIFGVDEVTTECSQKPAEVFIDSINVMNIMGIGEKSPAGPWVYGHLTSNDDLTVQVQTAGCGTKSSFDLIGFTDSKGKDHMTFLYNEPTVCLTFKQDVFTYSWKSLGIQPRSLIDVR